MKYIAIFLCILGLTMAADYTDQQQVIMGGLRLSYQLGEAHEKYMQGGDATSFNALIEQWNAWVRANFGEDSNMLMQKVIGPVDLSKPYLLANNTTGGGVVHAIDGSNKAGGSKYTTNDINLLPSGAIDRYQTVTDVDPKTGKRITGDGYLGGV
jgi:hypothetical protein